MDNQKKLEWIAQLDVGSLVHDCHGEISEIVEIDGEDYSCSVVLKNGHYCSAYHCLSPPEEDK